MKFIIALVLLVATAYGQITYSGGVVSGVSANPTAAAAPLVITTNSLPPGVQGTAYSQSISASGGQPAYVFSLSTTAHTVTLSWTASQAVGVTGYNVKRGTSPGGPYSTIGSTSSTNFTDPNVVNGNTYYYIVTVVAGIESGNSNEGTAIIPSGSALPPGLGLTTGGIISGNPTTAGNYTFTVKVNDQAASQATKDLSIQITTNTTVADNRYCTTGEAWIAPTTDGVASLPTACVYTALSGTPSPGTTITVCPLSAGSCDYQTVQAAVNAATCGQIISIWPTSDNTPSGTPLVYNESVRIPDTHCAANNWIRVQSSLINSLPPEGNRIHPCWAGYPAPFGRPAPAFACPASGTYMPVVRNASTCVPPSQTNPSGCSLSATGPVLTTGPTGTPNHPTFWRFMGIMFLQDAADPQIGGDITRIAGASHLILDRVVIKGGDDVNGQSRENYCKGVNGGSGAYQAIIDSYIYDVHSVWPAGVPNHIGCTDAIAAFMGGTSDTASDNVFKLVNNFLESSSEPFFTGGGAATVVNTDYEIRRNHTFHPLFWKSDCSPSRAGCQGYTWFGTQFGIKNLGEFKNGSRVLIEGNIFTNNWRGDADQKGNVLLLTPKNANNTCIVCSVNNVTIRYNFGEHFTNGIQIAPGAASQGGTIPDSEYNIVMHNNIFDDINGSVWDSNPTGGCCSYGQGANFGSSLSAAKFHDVYFDHNTFLNYATSDIALSKSPTVGLASISIATGNTPANFSFTNNISVGAPRGSSPGGAGTGQCVGNTGGTAIIMNQCFTTTWCIDGNVMALQDDAGNVRPNNPYPGTSAYNASDPSSGSPNCARPKVGNQAPATQSATGFVNFNGGNGGDYRLCTGVGVPASQCLAASPYLNSSNDGAAPGANVTLVLQNIAGVQ